MSERRHASEETHAEKRQRRKKRYEMVYKTVAMNTTDEQPPGVTAHRLKQICTRRFDAEGVESSIRAAVENGDLFAWRDWDGSVRYTRMVEPALERVRDRLVAQEFPDRQQIGRVNRALQEVRDGD